MSLEKILYKIRKRENVFYSKIKDILLAIIKFNVPAPKFIFRPLFEFVTFYRFFRNLVVEKMISVPIFKSRLDRCGAGLQLPNGIPWIEGHIKIYAGENVLFDKNAITGGSVYEEPCLTIGDRSGLGFGTQVNVAQSVTIGNDCMIAAGCLISDNDSHSLDPSRRLQKLPVLKSEIKPVVIEDNVWIGIGAVILKGVTIGKGSIVAANSLVTRSVPPSSVVMGVPAKILMSGIDKVNFTSSAEETK